MVQQRSQLVLSSWYLHVLNNNLLSHNEVMVYLVCKYIHNKRSNNHPEYGFKAIQSYQRLMKPSDKHCKGIKFKVFLKWKDCDNTYEPLNMIAVDDPVTCESYGKQNNLLHIPGLE
jgi:hypothetical protein